MPTNFPSDKKIKRGDIASFSADGIACVKWKDNQAVLLLSNFISPIQTVLVQRRSAGRKERMDVPCPLVVKEYNKAMGGVDLMDQKKVTYEVDRRSKIKYYLRIFFYLLDIGVNNAYICYMKLQAKNANTPALTSLEFRQAVARSLIGSFSSHQRGVTGIVQTQIRVATFTQPITPEHQMAKGDSRKRCAYCTKSKVENRTFNYCTVCEVHLYFIVARNCFQEFHNAKT
uniref:Putative piggybac transposable element-derived n=1 Tax=Ixodes ricinus TaxID=34613 RepID=A0A6B0V4K9_IXORI